MEENATQASSGIDWALQEVISQVATAADRVGADDPAYTLSVVDVRNARLLVYRKSLARDNFDVQKYLTLAPAGVSIAFQAAALSATEIAHLNDLIDVMSPEFKAAGIKLHGWGPRDYASGIEVLYTSDTPRIPRHLLERLEIYGSGTVVFKLGSVEGIADRQADTSPFVGGARIHGPYRDGGASPAQCTSNFAGKSTANGQYYEMTAWHCYKPTDKRFWAIAGSSATNFIGSVSSTDAARDLAFIQVANGQRTLPLIYDGDHNNPQQLKAVNGSASPQVGNLVCTSGASLAVVCNVRISSTWQWYVENFYIRAGAASGPPSFGSSQSGAA